MRLFFFLFRSVIMGGGIWLAASGAAWAQAPPWQSVTVNPDGYMAADAAAGCVYETGALAGYRTFGATTLHGTDPDDIYVAKRTISGNYLWATRIGGIGGAVWISGLNAFNFSNLGVATDATGNIYFAGTYLGTQVSFGTTTLVSAPNASGFRWGTDGFVAKFSPTAGWQWAKRMGTVCRSVKLDRSGNVYATGEFGGTTAFGPTTLATVESTDIFVAKLSPAGAWHWAVQAGNETLDDDGVDLAIDDQGAVYVAGHIWQEGIVTFGAITLDHLTAAAFVAKLSPAGVWQWLRSTDSTPALSHTITEISELVLDGRGNLYLTGSFYTSARFGTTTLTSVTPSPDVFVAKLTVNGDWQWARSAGGAWDDVSAGIALDVNRDVYLSGCFVSPTLTVGSTTLINDPGPQPYLNAGFVAKLSAAGVWQWAVKAGGPDHVTMWGVSVADDGTIYVSGVLYKPSLASGPTAAFGSLTATSPTYGFVPYLAVLANVVVPLPVEPNPVPPVPPVDTTAADCPASALSLRPNPARHVTQLQDLSSCVAIGEVHLFDVTGRLVRTYSLADGAVTLELDGLPAGLYVVRAGGQSRRLVVE